MTKPKDQRLAAAPYDEAFSFAKQKLEQYPSCEKLIWNTAVVLEAWMLSHQLPDPEIYDAQICGWYTRVLASTDEHLRTAAAGSLYSFFTRKECFDKAEAYLGYFPANDPDRKRRQAAIYSKTGRKEDAYKAYEEVMLANLNRLRIVINDLQNLYVEDEESSMAHRLVNLENGLAGLFEMGRFQEESAGLNLATLEKDVEETARIMGIFIESSDTLVDFTRSDLFQHMTFQPIETSFFDKLRQDLLRGFLDEETYGYMRGNAFWEGLKLQKRA